MSTEYFFVCTHHKTYLWAGSDGFSGWQFPHKNDNFMEALKQFLDEHKSCGIQYMSEHQFDDREGFKEIDVDWGKK